jgi:hypothetical protein
MTPASVRANYLRAVVQIQKCGFSGPPARTGCKIVGTPGDNGNVEVEGLGNAAGSRWYAPISELYSVFGA